MNGLVNIGFGNMVNAGRITAIIGADSAPSRRIIQNARDAGRAIDATQGRRTRAVIVMSDDHIVLSALLPETIAARCQSGSPLWSDDDMEKDDENE